MALGTPSHNSMQPMQGTGYALGQARGRIVREFVTIPSGCIMLLTYDQLKTYEQAQAAVRQRPVGMIIVGAMPLSHIMIRFLGLGIPIVVVTAAQATSLPADMEVVIDGNTGLISAAAETKISQPMPPAPGVPVTTADGQKVSLRTSIGDVESAGLALRNGATAIGLLRSECLQWWDPKPPDADFYYAALKQICLAAQPLAVAIRLLDIAPDKLPAWLPTIPGTGYSLGLQGIRLYRTKTVRDVINAELEAIARLANEFSISVLLPYVTYADEFRGWHDEFARLLPPTITIGAMAETPAAALAIDELFRYTRLVALGCNDLMQCLCAANRTQPEVSAYLQPYSPVLFRFLRYVAESAGDHLNQIQLCGLLSQVPGIMPIMLGLGYRAFSVEATLVPPLAEVVHNTDTREAKALATAVCAVPDAAAVRTLLDLPAREAWALTL